MTFHFNAERTRLHQTAQRVFYAPADRTLRPKVTSYALASLADVHRDLPRGATTGQAVLLLG